MKNKSVKKQTYQFGVLSEKIAINFLRLKGYTIINRRYKNSFGEIDIIAKKHQTLIFIEVKARKKSELIEVILRQKQIERIKKSAEFFIATNEEYQNYDVRFDFILFSESLLPQHYKAYFE